MYLRTHSLTSAKKFASFASKSLPCRWSSDGNRKYSIKSSARIVSVAARLVSIVPRIVGCVLCCSIEFESLYGSDSMPRSLHLSMGTRERESTVYIEEKNHHRCLFDKVHKDNLKKILSVLSDCKHRFASKVNRARARGIFADNVGRAEQYNRTY